MPAVFQTRQICNPPAGRATFLSCPPAQITACQHILNTNVNKLHWMKKWKKNMILTPFHKNGHISLNHGPIWKIQKLTGSWELARSAGRTRSIICPPICFIIRLGRKDGPYLEHWVMGSRSKFTWVKVKLGSQTKAGGLTTTSSCFIILGDAHLICWYAFPPIVAKWSRPTFKTNVFVLLFIAFLLWTYLRNQ